MQLLCEDGISEAQLVQRIQDAYDPSQNCSEQELEYCVKNLWKLYMKVQLLGDESLYLGFSLLALVGSDDDDCGAGG